jgi:hypothetical protein
MNIMKDNLDYFYIKSSNCYTPDYSCDITYPYILFRLEIKEVLKTISPKGLNFKDYHYIFKETLIFKDFKNNNQINNYVDNEYAEIFICRNNEDKTLCLFDNSSYGLSPKSIINFGKHDDMDNLFIFYNEIKLDVKTLEDALKEILFLVLVKEY